MLLALFIHVKAIKTINLNDIKWYLQCIYIKKLIKGWPVLRAYNGFNPAMPAPDQFQSHTKYTVIYFIFYCYLFIYLLVHTLH
jgi:hypothetical protein